MNDLSNLFNNISNVFNINTTKETYLNPFTAPNYSTNFKELNNNDDNFTSKNIEEEVTKTIQANSASSSSDKTATANAILRKLKELSGDDISSTEFLQNFNATISKIDDPVLQNTLRKQLTSDISNLNDEKLEKLYNNQDARKQWGEIAYESSLAKLKENSSDLNNRLEKLVDSGDQKSANQFVTEAKKEFGSIENLNELFKDAGIKYKITGTDDKYKIERSTESSTSTKVEDKKVKDGDVYRENLDTWNKNAEYINNLDTSKFKDKDKKANAQKEISELANLSKDDIKADKYTDEELKKKFELLTKAYKHNLETGELSKAELEQARMNLIELAHANEKDDIDAWRSAEKKNPKENPDYTGTFSDEISKLNTIASLRDKGIRENLIEPGLKSVSKALGHTDANGNGDIKKATGGEDSELNKLLEAVRNPAPQKTEDPETTKLSFKDLKSISYNEKTSELEFKGDKEYSIKLNEFLRGLSSGSIKAKDAEGKLSELEIDSEKTKISLDGNNYNLEISSKDGKKFNFTINKEALTDEIVKEATNDKTMTVEKFIKSIQQSNQ